MLCLNPRLFVPQISPLILSWLCSSLHVLNPRRRRRLREGFTASQSLPSQRLRLSHASMIFSRIGFVLVASPFLARFVLLPWG